MLLFGSKALYFIYSAEFTFVPPIQFDADQANWKKQKNKFDKLIGNSSEDNELFDNLKHNKS